MSKIVLDREVGPQRAPIDTEGFVYFRHEDGKPAFMMPDGTEVVIQDIGNIIVDHENEVDPHPQYLTEEEIAQVFAPITQMAAHLTDPDPHPQYLTEEDGDGRYALANIVELHEALSNPHPQYLTLEEGNAAFDALGTVVTHEGLSDPHPQYMTESEVAALYAALNHIHATANLLTVSKSPAPNEFSSVAAAVAFALSQTPSTTNRFLVQMGPGVFDEAPNFNIPAYVYVTGGDPWNTSVLKTTDLTQDFITVSPNGGLFNVGVSGPTTAGKSAIKQVGSGTTKLYWVNIKEGSYGVTLSPASGVARCHCIGVVTDGPTVMNRLFNCDNPAGVGVFILMQSGPMSTTWIGTQPTAVYMNGNGSTGPYKSNATLDLCQFRGSGYDAVYADNAGLVRGISCSFAGGTNAIHVGPNGASKVDMHGSQIKPDGWTKDIWCESASGVVSFSGVATESKITIANGATFVANFADTSPDIAGQVIYGELWIGNKNVKTPFASYIQADKNTGLVSGGGISRGSGSREIDIAAGSAFIDTPSGLKHVLWNDTTIVVPSETVNTEVYVDNTGTILLSSVGVDRSLNCVLGEVGTNTTTVTYVSNQSILLPQFRGRLYDYLESVIGPINVSGGLVTANGLGFDISASVFYLTEVKNITVDITEAHFTHWHRDGSGGWMIHDDESSISPTYYDDGSGNLTVPMTDGYWRRDTVYVIQTNDSTDVHVIMGQEQFATQIEAVNNPIPPDPIAKQACRLAALVIQKGASTFTVVDQRPRLGQMAVPSTGVVTHDELGGRDSPTAHMQYQLESKKGQPNGYAPLDENNLIPVIYVPANTHGNQAGGTLHSVATTSSAGFMSGSDKTKLDGIAANASANNTDVYLLDRSHHTGGQAIDTVTGLQTALDGKEAAGTASGFMGSHLSDPDPHTQYLTAAEGNSAYSATGHNHSDVTPGGASGYMTGNDKTKLDSLTLANVPSETEKNALTGTAGSPGVGNEYVTSQDTRLINARVPIPSGTTKNIQYNNSGTQDGASNVLIDTDERLLLVPASHSQVVDPPATGVKTYGRSRAGRIHLEQQCANVMAELQTALFTNQVGLWIPQGNSLTVTNIGIPAGTGTGNNTARNVTTSSLLASLRRIAYLSSNPAGNVCGWREGVAQVFLGNVPKLGGFFIVIRFGFGGIAGDSRWFIGLDNSTAAPTNTEPTTINNAIGFGCRAADSNIQAWGRASSNITPQDTGIPGKVINAVYEVRLFAKSNSSIVNMSIQRLDTDEFYETNDVGAFSAVPPVNTLLGLKMWMTNGASAGVVAIEPISIYKETEY